MAKLLYSACASLDGFIAGPGGDMQWLNRLGPNAISGELVPRIGALLIGHNTWGGDDPNRGTDKEGPFGGAWSGPQFVLAHEPPAEVPPDVHFSDDLATAIAASREAAGEKEYVNVLGADVARQCIELGELDEVLMAVAPVMLGEGVRMFEHQGGAEVALEPISVEAEPGGTNLWFRVAGR